MYYTDVRASGAAPSGGMVDGAWLGVNIVFVSLRAPFGVRSLQRALRVAVSTKDIGETMDIYTQYHTTSGGLGIGCNNQTLRQRTSVSVRGWLGGLGSEGGLHGHCHHFVPGVW